MTSVSLRHIFALLLILNVAMGADPAIAQQNETRIALVIGNASYPDAETPLKDPVNNARALTDELRQNGFEVDVGENLTKEATRAAFDRFYSKIKPGSTALCSAQHGDFSRAVKDFDEVIRLNPRDVEGLNNRCWARAMIGELQPALRDCDAALELRPRYLDALDSRGFVNLKLGQPKNAIADYDAALRINPKHPSALYGRGIAKMRTGNSAGGDGDVAAAKLIQPGIADEFASYGIP